MGRMYLQQITRPPVCRYLKKKCEKNEFREYLNCNSDLESDKMMTERQILIADKSLSEIKKIIIDSNFPAGFLICKENMSD